MRVMSYNIHSGRNMDNVLDLESIGKVILKIQPDLCALNEVRMRTRDVFGREQARDLAKQTGMDWRFGRAIDYNGGEYGNAMLSRFPILSSRTVPVPQLPEEEREQRYEPRAVLECIVQTDQGPMQALTCHFGLSRREQEVAVETVLSMLREDMPSVFMGDLNIAPDSDLIAKLRKRLCDTAENTPNTFSAREPYTKIDYIFVSPEISCGQMQTLDTLASDHLPVYADMCIRPDKRKQAVDILHESGLWSVLSEIGEPHLIGSVRMNLMAANDIDVDILNNNMHIERLYKLTDFILQKFRPKWYEAKEEITDEGKTVWFQGFKAIIGGELWNFDLWFFDRETIDKAEAFCDGIAARAKADPAVKKAILDIKDGLIERNLYRFDLYHSMDVYSAVLDQGVRTLDEFLAKNPRSFVQTESF